MAAAFAPDVTRVLDELRGCLGPFLDDCFRSYGADPAREIEARVKGVTRAGFEFVLMRLRSNAALVEERSESMDFFFPGDLRETRVLGRPSQFVRKVRLESRDMRYDMYRPIAALRPPELGPRMRGPSAGAEELGGVRVALCMEETMAPPGMVGALGEPSRVRQKRRFSFLHKGEFRFELTEVREGRSEIEVTMALPKYEVELEWCGHEFARRYEPAVLKEKMVRKIWDLMVMLAFTEAREP